MKILTNEQQELYKSGKICYICKKSLKINVLKTTNILKLEIIVIIQVNTELLNIVYVT